MFTEPWCVSEIYIYVQCWLQKGINSTPVVFSVNYAVNYFTNNFALTIDI